MAYIGKTPSQATRSRFYYTATGGETSLSGVDNNGNTLVFSDGNFVDVILNGVTLVAGTDYNTTTTNTISGLSALTSSDVVEIIVYDTFSVFGGDVKGDFTIQNGTLTAGDATFTGTVSGINTDLVNDTTPQLGGNLDTNGNDITFGDNDKAIFGAGSDLQIYHASSTNNSVIQETGSGNLLIYASNISMADAGGNQFILMTDTGTGGTVELKHTTSTKLATTSTGIDVTGTVTADGLTVDGDITLNDNSPTIIFDDANGVDQNFTFAVNGGTANIQSRTDAGVNTTRLTVSSNGNIDFKGGDISFYESTGTTPKLFWDASAERLGIGTSNPSYKLHVRGADATANLVVGNTTEDTRLEVLTYQDDRVVLRSNDSGNTARSLAFETGTTERMRIDSSGNLLVGSTSDAGTDYHLLANDGFARHVRDSATVMILDRTTSDGSIALFRKDGTTVGSIESKNSDSMGVNLYPAGNIGVRGVPSAVIPFGNGSDRDATTDLGRVAHRFRNGYFSGGVYLGGTGAANKLDDYEEGTWTPALTTSGSAPTITYGVQDGTYTKIGRTVIVNCQLFLLSKSGGTGAVYMTGLPFAVDDILPNTSVESVGAMTFTNMAQDVSCAWPRANHGAGGIDFVWTDGGGDANVQTLNIGNIGSTWNIRMTVTYFTA